jgi:hypothetical protein
MRKIAIAALAVLFVGIAITGSVVTAQDKDKNEPEKKYASWDEHLYELGYRLFINSTINVINGVNLTREQAVKLRELAKEAEKKGMQKPETKGKFMPEVEKVRKTFMEIQKTLIERKEVSEELNAKLLEARKLESKILREGLTSPVRGEKYASCRRCHAKPSFEDGKITYDVSGKKWKAMGAQAKSQRVKREMAIAHLSAAMKGDGGFKFMARDMSKRVAAVLTDNQKEVVGSFSCCLVPPKSLSDPVRVGQADVAEWQVEMLEKARKCPDRLWSVAKKRTLNELEKGAVIADPGMTEEKKRKERKRIGDLLDKARALSDVDFEMEKEELASQIKPQTTEMPEYMKDFNSAFFLLMPGSVEVYDKLIAHLDSQESLKGTDKSGTEKDE